MSQKPIREYSGKRLIANWFSKHSIGIPEAFKTISSMLLVTPTIDLEQVESPFPSEARLVAKPDQLLKRRGKLGLIKLNATWREARDWIAATRSRKVTVDNATDELNYFLVEPFIPHKSEEEHYLCIRSIREGDEILFYHRGGVDVGDVEDKASRLVVPVGDSISRGQVTRTLLTNIDDNQKQDMISEFIEKIFDMYAELHFCYLEINPLVVLNDLSGVYILDLAAKLDSAAEFQCHSKWSDVVEFPPFFGHHSTSEEKFVQELDERTGASLKLTILNPAARVWTLVAGGGASVIYADTVADLGFADELGNYGEYSGAPTQELTYQYANTLIHCMLKYPRKEGKVLLIGGGIANFTDVAETFTGVIQALEENKEEMINQKTKVYVRRGGPNYQRGLKLMKECADKTGLDIQVFGPETHITAIVSMALLSNYTNSSNEKDDEKTQLQDLNVEGRIESLDLSQFKWNNKWEEIPDKNDSYYVMSEKTKAIVYGMQIGAVQNMLDFDYISRRDTPSVAAIVYDFSSGMHHRQFYWGHKEVMIPVFKDLKDALSRYKDVDTVVNFASSRSAYQATLEMLNFSQIKHITIIAEGVPERHTRHLIRKSKETNTIILGPSTVGGVKPGAFRIGNTGGMLDNIVASKLHRPGSVAFVSKSGGLSNELANIISRCTNGVIEGMAIGGDRHPITTFMDNLIQYQRDPRCKILVVLGEVGGVLEYEVAEAVQKKIITKPVIAWCTGTCTRCFKHDVQFGHAGAMAQSTVETAMAKNLALAKAGCLVPESFDDFPRLIKFLYQRLIKEKVLNEADYKEVEPPPIPVDYSWARKLGLVRKPAGFLSSISDDRGEELVYAGMPISQVFSQDLGIGGVVGLLWFRRRLPDYANTFIEMVLMVTADHGPAVSGAHNTIVTARAGKDLISSLCTGLLTIGPRFGGALDDAAKMFTRAYDSGLTPEEFVEKTRKSGKLISGIGHLVKSLENPDKRVEIVIDFAKKNFDSTCVLDYALQVQKVTTRKKSNLILNVDGAVACAFVDLLRGCKLFSQEEADQYVKLGSLNALFVLGRSIGFIGHFLDQKRLGQGLYRHPTDDITYFLHDLPTN